MNPEPRHSGSFTSSGGAMELFLPFWDMVLLIFSAPTFMGRLLALLTVLVVVVGLVGMVLVFIDTCRR